MSAETTTVEIYTDDIPIIVKNRMIKQEPNRDSLHRLLVAGEAAIKDAQKPEERKEAKKQR